MAFSAKRNKESNEEQKLPLVSPKSGYAKLAFDLTLFCLPFHASSIDVEWPDWV